MSPLDVYASEIQYWHHLLPIWRALDPDERGTVWTRRDLVPFLAARGIPPETIREGWPDPKGGPILVASYQDGRASRRRYVYVEHGAGQTYDGDPAAAGHGSYSGGNEHDRALLFLTPGETVAARWRTRYPSTPAVAVGVPKLDWHHTNWGWKVAGRARLYQRRPNIGISFHARNPLCPESNTAWMEYDPILPALADALRIAGWTIWAHAHPRIAPKVRARCEKIGVDFCDDFLDLLELVDVYACDNSSTLYEAASCGIPVVAINSKHYRRDVHHGLRFWDTIPGIECDRPEDLPTAAAIAVSDPDELRDRRERAVRKVYVACDGHAAERTVDAIRAYATAAR